MKIEYTTRFLRKAKKLQINDQRKLSERIEWFSKNMSDPRLKTHVLSGKFSGYYSFSLDYSKRVVGRKIDTDTITLIDVGSHDEVYR